MRDTTVRYGIVTLLGILVAVMAVYPLLRDPAREFPLVVIALLGALCVHALYQAQTHGR